MIEETEIVSLVKRALEHTQGHRVNSVGAVWAVMNEAPEGLRPEVLREAAFFWDEFEGGGTIPAPSDFRANSDETEEMRKKYGELADAMLRSVASENLEEVDFYVRLHEALMNPIFPSEKSKIFALYWMLLDPLLPYFRAPDTMAMSNERFREVKDEIRQNMKLISHFMARRFPQKTQQADAVLKAILSIESEEGRVVAMATLVTAAKDGLEAMSQLRQANLA